MAGRKTPPAAPRLDEAWEAIVARLAADELRGLPLVTGGRSSGARVACRTAVATGAAGVLCLAFPLHPPGAPRERPASPSSTRRASPRSSSRATATRSACRRPAPA